LQFSYLFHEIMLQDCLSILLKIYDDNEDFEMLAAVSYERRFNTERYIFDKEDLANGSR